MGGGGVWGHGFGVLNSVSLERLFRLELVGMLTLSLHRTSHLLWADGMESVDWTVDGALGSLGRAIGLQV